jgi:DNA-directed RNA polymerase specialized sigma24 family protein
MRNAVFDAVKGNGVEVPGGIDADWEIVANDDPERDVVSAKAADIMAQLIHQLPDLEFQVLVMAMNEMNLKRIAKENGWKLWKVYATLRNARERLKSWCKALELEVRT